MICTNTDQCVNALSTIKKEKNKKKKKKKWLTPKDVTESTFTRKTLRGNPFFRVYFLKFSVIETKRNDSYC